jgi:hypothetical protein
VNPLKRLDECYERGLLLDVPASQEKVLLSIVQAREWIVEARQDLDADALRPGLIAVYMGYFPCKPGCIVP